MQVNMKHLILLLSILFHFSLPVGTATVTFCCRSSFEDHLTGQVISFWAEFWLELGHIWLFNFCRVAWSKISGDGTNYIFVMRACRWWNWRCYHLADDIRPTNVITFQMHLCRNYIVNEIDIGHNWCLDVGVLTLSTIGADCRTAMLAEGLQSDK